MSTINILVKGLAVCFRERDNWKFIFLCDDRHRLKFTHRRKDVATQPEQIELRKKNREIYFDMINTQPVTEPEGEGFKHIFNMNSLYAHRGNIKLKSLKDIPEKRDVITMTIQNAQLYTAQPTPEEFPKEEPYHIMVKDKPETETIIHVVARVVGARIALNPGGNIHVRGRDTDFPSLASSPYEAGTNYDLIFDNDCGDDCGDEDDFREYYDLLYEESGLQFIAGRPPLIKSNPDAKGAMLLVPDGNCDPIVIKPPLG